MATTYSITGNSAVFEGGRISLAVTSSLPRPTIMPMGPEPVVNYIIPYSITGIDPARIGSGSKPLSGTLDFRNSLLIIDLSILANQRTDGPTTVTVNIDNGAYTYDIQVIDSSRESNIPTLTAGKGNYDEGTSAIFTLTNGTPNSYGQYYLSGISSADTSHTGLSYMNFSVGTVLIDSSGSGAITIPLLNDGLTEGSETLTVLLQPYNLTASTVINDTSNALPVTPTQPIDTQPVPVYGVLAQSSSVNEGSTATFIVNTININGNAPGKLLPYTLSGSGINAADVLGGSLSGNAVVNSNYQATISVTLLGDITTEGAETLTVTAGGQSASIVINDTSIGTSATPTQPVITQPVLPVISTPTFTTSNSISISTGSLAVNSTAANDLITGTTATDTVVYEGSIKDYKVAIGSNGSYTVIDAVSSRDGSDVVANVERLKFLPDATTGANRIALDLSPTQASGKAALLIGAVLPGKLALDPEKYQLMGVVIDLFDQGFTLQQLSGALLRLPIWGILTGKPNPTNADIATYLVNNVYGVTSQTANLGADLARSLAIDAMNAETPATQGTYLATLATSTASQTHIDLVGIQSTGLVYLG